MLCGGCVEQVILLFLAKVLLQIASDRVEGFQGCTALARQGIDAGVMEDVTQIQPQEVDGIKQLAKAASLRLRPLKTSDIRTEPGPAVKFTPGDDEPTSPVTPVGRAFSQPDLNVVILCIVGLAEKPGLQHMQEFLRGTLVKHRRFHSIMVSA